MMPNLSIHSVVRQGRLTAPLVKQKKLVWGDDANKLVWDFIEPKILFAADGYEYNGKSYDKSAVLQELVRQLPTVEKVIVIPFLGEDEPLAMPENGLSWAAALNGREEAVLFFEQVPFDHPIWVLYSSGTTGLPSYNPLTRWRIA